MEKYKTGVVIGRFEPPHYGHTYMIDFAATKCETLHVLLYSLKEEVIPGRERFMALSKHYKAVYNHEFNNRIKVKWIQKPMPQQPEEHPNFWNIWKEDISMQVEEPIDCIFGSEPYVETLGEYLECESELVDVERRVVPVSGTMCRNDFVLNWDYIIPEMRHYFLKKICFVGGESTGKSTITRMMAKVFQTEYVPEYARTYCLVKNPNTFVSNDFLWIARNQQLSEKKMAETARRFLFCDTDAITTKCFYELYLGEETNKLDGFISDSNYDLYFLLAPTIEFDQDGTRDFPEVRQKQFELLKENLERYGREYVVIEEPDFGIRINLIKFEIEKRFCK